MFTDLAIYDAHSELSYESINYSPGFHAQGKVKIFIFPEFIMDATLSRNPSLFHVSLQLEKPIIWGAVALCGEGSCSTTGPSLSIQVGSGMNKFEFDGEVRFFDVDVGALRLVVSRDIMSATFTITEQVQQQYFFGLPGTDPISVQVYWNSQGLHTNLQIPGLMFDDFMFTDIKTRSLCQKLGRKYLSRLAVNAPFHLDNSFIVKEFGNDTLWLGIVFRGYVTLDVLGEDTGLNATISPKPIGFTYRKGQRLTWGLLLESLKSGLLKAGKQILDDLVNGNDTRAVELMLANKLGQLAVDQAAEAACDRLLEEEPPEPEPEPEDPVEEFDPEAEEFPDLSGAALAADGVIEAEGAASLLEDLVVGNAAAAAACFMLRMFGGCRSPSDDDDDSFPPRDEEAIRRVKEMTGVSCDNNYCDHHELCRVNGDHITCSCRDGYYLDSDGHSCISKFFGINNCSTFYLHVCIHVCPQDMIVVRHRVHLCATLTLAAWILLKQTRSRVLVRMGTLEMEGLAQVHDSYTSCTGLDNLLLT